MNTVTELVYGLSSLYYAPIIANGYAVPKALPGAVKINLSPEQYDLNFTGLDCIPRTDKSIVYGYKGSVVVAGLTADFCKDIYGDTVASDGSLIEKITTSLQSSAILFETDGTPATRYCFYNCTFGRPEFVGETKTKSVTVSTVSIPVIIRANSAGDIKRKNSDITSSAYKNWFTAVK